MRIKQFTKTSSITISLVICALLFVACDSDDNADSGFPQVQLAPVSAVELSVDNASFTGTCPHTFKFTGSITTSAAGIVGYRFRDLYDDFPLAEGIVDFSSAGTQTITREFAYSNSWQGEVILEIPSQNFLTSTSVPISATCS